MTAINGNRDSLRPSHFALVVGNARSGTTIVGSILDAHPRIICANETRASNAHWTNLSAQEIVDEIISNVEMNHVNQRQSSGYSYKIETAEKSFENIDVIADKIWNPTLLLLHGDRSLLTNLAQIIGCRILLVHCVRNPFDVIATMHQRSGADLSDRCRWYFVHCEAAQALSEREDVEMITVYHEELLRNSQIEIERLYRFLGQETGLDIFSNVRRVLFPEARRTGQMVKWPSPVVDEIRSQMARFAFLQRYELDILFI
jgi:Sulfotransferase domain